VLEALRTLREEKVVFYVVVVGEGVNGENEGTRKGGTKGRRSWFDRKAFDAAQRASSAPRPP